MAKTEVFILQCRFGDGYDENNFVFSSFERAVAFGRRYLEAISIADLDEYLAEADPLQELSDADRFDLYSAIVNEGSSGSYISIEPSQLDPDYDEPLHN